MSENLNVIQNSSTPEKRFLLKDLTPEQLEVYFDLKNIHNASHFMSPEDNQKLQELFNNNYWDGLVFLREKWMEYCDKEFMDDFTLVHWVPNSERGLMSLEELLGKSIHETEISTQGYRDSKSLKENRRWLNSRFGVLIRGTVTLASNRDAQTNQNLHDGKKLTEWANRLFTNEENCISPYEFLVTNWRPVAIIVDYKTEHLDEIRKVAEKFGLPVIDDNNNELFK